MKHATRTLSGKTRLVVWTAAGLAGTGLLAGVANAATSSGPAPSDTAAVTAAAGNSNPNSAQPHGKSRQVLQRKLAAASVRGEVVYDGKKGPRTVDFQRGTVSDASSSTFTVTDKSGTAQTWTISSDTKVRERTQGSASSAHITDGENVVVIGSNSDGKLTARLVVVVPAKA